MLVKDLGNLSFIKLHGTSAAVGYMRESCEWVLEGLNWIRFVRLVLVDIYGWEDRIGPLLETLTSVLS